MTKRTWAQSIFWAPIQFNLHSLVISDKVVTISHRQRSNFLYWTIKQNQLSIIHKHKCFANYQTEIFERKHNRDLKFFIQYAFIYNFIYKWDFNNKKAVRWRIDESWLDTADFKLLNYICEMLLNIKIPYHFHRIQMRESCKFFLNLGLI